MTEISCPVCGGSLRISPANSRKAEKKKVFLMLACPISGKHFRGFIGDQPFVKRVIEALNRESLPLDPTGTGVSG